MIRLMIASEEQERWQAVAARLRGVAIESCLDVSRCFDGPDVAQGVVFVGSRPIESDVVEQALRMGKHVLYAAEPCLPKMSWETLWDVARRSQVRLAVVNPDRYLPSRQLIKGLLPDKLGPPALVRIHRWEPYAAAANSGSILPGPLLRDVEVALALAGHSPNTVYALQQNLNNAGRILQIHLGYAEGGMALINYDNRLPGGQSYHSLTVIGSSGAAYADDHQNMQLLFRGDSPQTIRTEEGPRQFADMIQAFADALRDGRDLSEHVLAWRQVFTVADGIQEALASRRAVQL